MGSVHLEEVSGYGRCPLNRCLLMKGVHLEEVSAAYGRHLC